MSDRTASEYLSADDAANALGVKVASLYSYVSRGVVRSIQQPGTKAKLYYRDDIERAKTRMGGRAGIPETMESTVRWGQPMFTSAITALTQGGPVYRGRRALDLADHGRSFESVAELLWTGIDMPSGAGWDDAAGDAGLPALLRSCTRREETPTSQHLIALINTLTGVSSTGRPDYESGTTVADGRQLIRWYAAAMGYLGPAGSMLRSRSGSPVAQTLALALLGSASQSRPEAARAINTALILCADHELSPSTLAARVAASTGADLRACLLAAVATHSGGLLGGGCDRVQALMPSVRKPAELRQLIADLERSGQTVPGFNLVSYPKGDPRATRLLELARELSPDSDESIGFARLLDETRQSFDLKPSIEVGLVGLSSALRLPPKAASAIWTIGRTAGWIAHVMEQRLAGFMIRPRAKYVSPV